MPAAAKRTTQTILNCALREGLPHTFVKAVLPSGGKERLLVRVALKKAPFDLVVPMDRRSPLGMHDFAFPAFFAPKHGDVAPANLQAVNEALAAVLVLNELHDEERPQMLSQLLSRVHDSEQMLRQALQVRSDQPPLLASGQLDFLDAEQSLLFGHPFHPTPKSRIGFSSAERLTYSPETAGSFALHYFAVRRDHTVQRSLTGVDASELVRGWLVRDETVPNRAAIAAATDWCPVPVHPWQAQQLLRDARFAASIASGVVVDWGPLGKPFFPTSSVRTVYRDDCPWMVKLSLGLEITNSKRVNLFKELERGLETHQLLHSTALGATLREQFPSFNVITDPAYLAVRLPAFAAAADNGGDASATDSGLVATLSCTLRANPFHGGHGRGTVALAALCEQGLANGVPLVRIIQRHARARGMPAAAAGRAWFDRFLDVAIRPMLTIYLEHGLAFEAHQQNTLLTLGDDGMPERFHYRDNQGVFHRESAHAQLCELIPHLGEDTVSYGPEELVDERLSYYLLLNNVMVVADTLAAGGLLQDDEGLAAVQDLLQSLAPLAATHGRSMIRWLLSTPALPCKGNLRTRVAGMDELVGDPSTQSVYVDIPNMFRREEPAMTVSSKAQEMSHAR